MSMPTINPIYFGKQKHVFSSQKLSPSPNFNQPIEDSIHFSGKKSDKKKTKARKKADKPATTTPKTTQASVPQSASSSQEAQVLFKKYQLFPEDVVLKLPQGITLPKGVSKEELLFRLLEGHEHALKNIGQKNFTGRYFASNMLMDNHTWHPAANTELSKEQTFCAERSALVVGRNIALHNTPLEDISDTPIKVKLLTINDATNLYCAQNACFECQNWMKADHFFGPDVLISHLIQDQDGKPTITVKPLKELLPLNGTQLPSLTDKPIETLPIETTTRAAAIIDTYNIQTDDLVQLLKETREENQNTPYPNHSGKKDSVGILWSNRYISEADTRMDITATRSSISPLETALGNGIKVFSSHKNKPKIAAVAFYGPSISPSPIEVGFIAQQIWGNIESLVVTVENDTIQVRALQDFMTDIYVSPLKYAQL